MSVKNEVPINMSIIFSLFFSLFWRMSLISLLTFVLADILSFQNQLLIFLYDFVSSIIIVFLAIYWLFNSSRLGSKKIIFMEYAHYQKQLSSLEENTLPEQE